MEELEHFGGHAICLTTDVSNNNTSGAVFGTSFELEYSEKLLDGNDLSIKAFSRFVQAQKFLHLEKPGIRQEIRSTLFVIIIADCTTPKIASPPTPLSQEHCFSALLMSLWLDDLENITLSLLRSW